MTQEQKYLGLQIALTMLLFIATGVSSYVATSVLSNENRIVSLEAGSLNIADGKLLWAEFSAIRKEIHALKNEIDVLPLDEPPTWFLQRVDRIELRLDRMEAYLKGSER